MIHVHLLFRNLRSLDESLHATRNRLQNGGSHHRSTLVHIREHASTPSVNANRIARRTHCLSLALNGVNEVGRGAHQNANSIPIEVLHSRCFRNPMLRRMGTNSSLFAFDNGFRQSIRTKSLFFIDSMFRPSIIHSFSVP